MILRSLDISNFRSLESLSLTDLGRVNLLVGKNNSGKTTVLEALRVLADNAALRTLFELAVDREDSNPDEVFAGEPAMTTLVCGLFRDRMLGGSKISIGEPGSSRYMEIDFVQYQYIPGFDDEGRPDGGKRVIISPEEREILFSNGSEDEVRDALSIRVGDSEADLIRIDRSLPPGSVEMNSGRRTPLFPCAYVPARPTDVDDLAALWDRIALLDGDENVIKALQLIEPSIAGLTFIESDGLIEEARRKVDRRRVSSRGGRRIPVVRLSGSKNRVPLRTMGDGLHRILDVALKLTSLENGVLLIDEFENGLHYSIHATLWKLIFDIALQRNVQVFVTTHSDDCVGAFSGASLATEENGILFRIARPRGGDGEHFVRRYSESKLEDALSADMEIR